MQLKKLKSLVLERVIRLGFYSSLFFQSLYLILSLSTLSSINSSQNTGEICTNAPNEIAGTVFEDWNYDGIMNQNDTIGIAGVQVIATDSLGNSQSTQTDIDGNYQFTALNYSNYRIEFIVPTAISDWAKPTFMGADNGTTIQFVQAGDCANLGLASPSDYCDDNPQLITSCYVKGSANTSNREALVSFFESGGSNSTTDETLYDMPLAHPVRIPVDSIGAVWGVAYNRTTKKIYTGAYMKPYSGFGPMSNESTGAIYVIDNTPNNNTDAAVITPSIFMDLSSPAYFNGATGIRPHSNATLNAFAFNPAAFAGSGKIGLGDIEISDDGETLFTINLNTRELYEIPIGANGTAPPASDIVVTAMPTSFCIGDTLRPFGLAYHKGALYIGAVCAAEVSENVDNLWAYVFKYEPNTNTINPQAVLEFPLDYERGDLAEDNSGEWYPWLNNWDASKINYDPTDFNPTGNYWVYYPQPVLSDIAFDRGDMILSFLDRFGEQFNNGNDPDGGNFIVNAVPGGDILRAGYNGNDTWTIEANASVTGFYTNTTTTSGAGNGEGPATLSNGNYTGDAGEYYYKDGYPDSEGPAGFTGHHEIVVGGLHQIPGSTTTTTLVYDPLLNIAGEVAQGGVLWLDNQTGKWTKSYRLYDENVPQSYFKGNGFGDLEALCAAAPIQIGNYVWEDLNANGIQDAGEMPLANITVSIYKNGVKIAETQTDSNGQYYFSNQDAMDSNLIWYGNNADTTLLFNTNYELFFGESQYNNSEIILNNIPYKLSTSNQASNDAIDNDANENNINGTNYPNISIRTGTAGFVDHNLDVGFSPVCSNPNCYPMIILRD